MRRSLALSLAAALAVRLAVVALVREPPRWDGFFYARLAEALHAGHGYAVREAHGAMRPTAFYPPGYPAAMAALRALTDDPRLAAVGVNLVAALVACAAVVLITGRLFGPRAALRGGLAYALYPGAALWCAAAMTETLTGALLAVAFAATVLPRSERARGVGALVAGVALGAATLVRPQSLLTLPLTAVAAPTWRMRVTVALVAVVTAGAVVLPWTGRNCATLDGCALVSTNGGSNLLIGTFPDARGGYRRPTGADGCADVRGEVNRDRCMSQRAAERIREHPWRQALLAVMKLAVTFAWEHDPVSYARGERRDRFGDVSHALGVGLCTLAWWALVARALRTMRRSEQPGTGADTVAAMRWAVGAFATVAFTHGVFLGADRYHLLLVPLLCPAAAGGEREA